ncbi:MAG TPA: HAD family hydrolase [Methanolinea sp.]|nr:HAD family hydrolase [Methanolinea sp.]
MHTPRPVRALLIDMDNTLFDLVGAKRAACRAIVEKTGVGDADLLFSYFLRRTRGFEDPGNILDFLVDEGVYSDSLFGVCDTMYREVKLSNIEPYPGVRETLERLVERDYPLALVTDAHRNDAIPRLERAGVRGFFDHIITYDMTWQKKPDPVPFLYALQMINTTPGDAMIVGDSPRRDIAPGKKLGMTTVYARYGDRFSLPGTDGGADFTIDGFAQLLPLLSGLEVEGKVRRSPCAAGSPSR